MRISNRRPKEIESPGAPTAPHHARHAFLKSGAGEKPHPGPAEQAGEVFIPIAAAFNVEHRAHQRLPPSSPELQSSPRLYLSNQAFSLTPSSRPNRDSPLSFSQTTTLDG